MKCWGPTSVCTSGPVERLYLVGDRHMKPHYLCRACRERLERTPFCVEFLERRLVARAA